MRRDEIRDQVLLLARRLRVLVEQLLELVVGADARLHHLRKRPLADRLRRDLEVAAHVMLREFLDVRRRLVREIITHARSNQHLLHARHRARAPVEFDERRVVGLQVAANARVHAGRTAARGFDLRALAVQAVHVCGRPAQIGDDAGKPRHRVADGLDLAYDRISRTILDDPALVLGDRAKGAAAEASPLDGHRSANHIVGRNPGSAVAWVWNARVGQFVERIHLARAERYRRRIDPYFASSVPLHERPCVAGIGFDVQDARCVRVEHGIAGDVFVRGHPDHAPRAILVLHLANEAHHLHAGRRLALRPGKSPLLHRIGIERRAERSRSIEAR